MNLQQSFSPYRIIGVLVALAFGAPDAHAEEMNTKSLGEKHLAAIAEKPWASRWVGARISGAQRIEEKPDLDAPVNLPPVWRADVFAANRSLGYLMWEAEGEGRLVDFAIDAPIESDAPGEPIVEGAPPLQQFPMTDEDGQPIASGCVPTSAGSVLAYLIKNYHQGWRGDTGDDLARDLTLRFRSRMKMRAFPDVDGFTDNGMALAGSHAGSLSAAIRADAAEHNVAVAIESGDFDHAAYFAELIAGRPAVVMGKARVPHKPHLSWWHSVAAVGSTEINGVRYVGFHDNWWPSTDPAAVRWLPEDAMHALVAIRPAAVVVGSGQSD